jgi:hypothetical protein
MGVLVILLIVGVIALIIVGAVVSAKKERERTEQLAVFARSIGLTFDPAQSSAIASRFAHFELFRRGDTRRGWNTMHGPFQLGEIEGHVTAGDYRYTVESGSGKSRSRTTYRVSYLIVRPDLPLRATLSFRSEHVFDKLAGAIGFDDIDFESAEFSRRFHVKCDDRKFAYDLFDPRMMEWMLKDPPPSLQLAAGEILIHVSSRRWDISDFEHHLAWTREFFGKWPAHLVRRLAELPR